MLTSPTIAIAVISGLVAGMIFYAVTRVIQARRAQPDVLQPGPRRLDVAIDEGQRAAASAATARLIAALERRE